MILWMGYLPGIHKQTNDLLKFYGMFCEYLCTFFLKEEFTLPIIVLKTSMIPKMFMITKMINCLYLPGPRTLLDTGHSV